jgi:hypothetical protein
MAHDRVNLVRTCQTALHRHGYSSTDVTVLLAVADRENATKRKFLFDKELKAASEIWRDTWCYASLLRLAYDTRLSERAVRLSLAKSKRDGLLLVGESTATTPTRRAINVRAFLVLISEYTEVEREYRAWRQRTLADEQRHRVENRSLDKDQKRRKKGKHGQTYPVPIPFAFPPEAKADIAPSTACEPVSWVMVKALRQEAASKDKSLTDDVVEDFEDSALPQQTSVAATHHASINDF